MHVYSFYLIRFNDAVVNLDDSELNIDTVYQHYQHVFEGICNIGSYCIDLDSTVQPAKNIELTTSQVQAWHVLCHFIPNNDGSFFRGGGCEANINVRTTATRQQPMKLFLPNCLLRFKYIYILKWQAKEFKSANLIGSCNCLKSLDLGRCELKAWSSSVKHL